MDLSKASLAVADRLQQESLGSEAMMLSLISQSFLIKLAEQASPKSAGRSIDWEFCSLAALCALKA